MFLALPFALVVLTVVALRSARVAVAFGLHALLVFALSTLDLLTFDSLPPRIPLVALATVVAGVLVGRGVPRLRALPTWGLVAFQAFRAPLEFTLYALHREGLVPAQLTFTGRNFDVLVGLTAPLVAWLAATGRASPRLLKVWNALGVLLLINVVAIAITSAPGPLHGDWPGEPVTFVARWPFVLLPTLLVPLAALGHVALAARLLRGERGEGPHVAPTAAQSRSSSR